MSKEHQAITSIPTDEKKSVKNLTGLVAASFRETAADTNLCLPRSQTIRAGLAGGLPFDGLTTDLFLGCLPASQICYGNCFAAKEAFASGFDFTRRVPNVLNEDILRQDLAQVSPKQGFLRNGWNSDPSWDWALATRVGELIHAAGKHPVFLTKGFRAPDEHLYSRLSSIGAELRVCVSAFDTDAQLNHRIQTMLDYRDRGGLSVPVVMSAFFKEDVLNSRQATLVDRLLAHDLPAAENSIRFSPKSPVIRAINVDMCATVAGTQDVWAGRIFAESLIIPTLSSVHEGYRGVEPYRSANHPNQLAAMFADPVPSHAEVRQGVVRQKPACAGVAMVWNKGAVQAVPHL